MDQQSQVRGSTVAGGLALVDAILVIGSMLGGGTEVKMLAEGMTL